MTRARGGKMGRGAEESSPRTFRIPNDILEQLSEAHWSLRRTETDIVLEALADYFRKHRVKRPK